MENYSGVDTRSAKLAQFSACTVSRTLPGTQFPHQQRSSRSHRSRFILFGTLLGLTPVKETFTSHFIVTLMLALVVFIYANVLAFRSQGTDFLRHFLPAGVPLFVAPILVFVEVVSYLFRPITFGFRLFANIFAGHVMLKLFGDFAAMLVTAFGNVGVLAALLPVAVMIVLIGVEIAIACIQSYIFMLITSVYLIPSVHNLDSCCVGAIPLIARS